MVNRNEGKEWRALKARATIKKNRRIDATRTFLARAHAGIYAEGYIPVLLSSLLHLRVSASFRCYFAFESLLPFFGSGTITRMRGSLSLSLSWPPLSARSPPPPRRSWTDLVNQNLILPLDQIRATDLTSDEIGYTRG